MGARRAGDPDKHALARPSCRRVVVVVSCPSGSDLEGCQVEDQQSKRPLAEEQGLSTSSGEGVPHRPMGVASM